jgi:cytochrome bd-type quinol oxidase subunit 2
MTQIERELLIFVAIPAIYSIAFFGWCYLAERMPIFSKRNSRSSLTVICGHITILLLLIMLGQVAFQFYPSLPSWLTDKTIQSRGSSKSAFEILCVLFVVLIGIAEKRWIYVDSRMGRSASKKDPS